MTKRILLSFLKCFGIHRYPQADIFTIFWISRVSIYHLYITGRKSEAEKQLLAATARSITSVMAKQTASTFASQTRKIFHWHGCFMECCHHIRNCKKTESVIRMTAVKGSHQLCLFSFLIQGQERLSTNIGIQENLTYEHSKYYGWTGTL